jgi:hypothetical protein
MDIHERFPEKVTGATGGGSAHLLNNLVSYWKLDVEPANVTPDAVGSNHLTSNGVLVAGLINNAMQFTAASNQNAYSVSNASLQVTGSFTFSLWVKLFSQIANCSILEKGTGSTWDYALRYYNPTATGFYFAVAGGTTTQDAIQGATIADGVWTHLVCWYDAGDSKVRLRINDATTVVASSTSPALIQSTDAFAIGGTGTIFSNSIVDEVGFWKRLLTAAEITALYNGGAGLPFSSFTA